MMKGGADLLSFIPLKWGGKRTKNMVSSAQSLAKAE